MNRILILGATGFLGSEVAISLMKQEYDVTLVSRSLKKTTPKIIKEKVIKTEIENLGNHSFGEFDYVINCISILDERHNTLEDIFYSNSLIPYKLFNILNFKKLIHISTYSIFAESFDKNSIPNPQNYYGISKYVSEKISLIEGGDKTIILRFPIIIGKNKNSPDIVEYIFNNLLKNELIKIYGPKNLGKNIIHVSEAVKAIRYVINYSNELEENIINVGSNDLISASEICYYFGKKLKLKPDVSFHKIRSGVSFNLDILNSYLINYECKSVKTNLDLYLKELL